MGNEKSRKEEACGVYATHEACELANDMNLVISL